MQCILYLMKTTNKAARNARNPHARIVQDANIESGRILADLNDLMRSCGPGATEADAKAAVELRDALRALYLRALYALMLASE